MAGSNDSSLEVTILRRLLRFALSKEDSKQTQKLHFVAILLRYIDFICAHYAAFASHERLLSVCRSSVQTKSKICSSRDRSKCASACTFVGCRKARTCFPGGTQKDRKGIPSSGRDTDRTKQMELEIALRSRTGSWKGRCRGNWVLSDKFWDLKQGLLRFFKTIFLEECHQILSRTIIDMVLVPALVTTKVLSITNLNGFSTKKSIQSCAINSFWMSTLGNWTSNVNIWICLKLQKKFCLC